MYVFNDATQAWDCLYEELMSQQIAIPSRAGTVVGEILNATITITDPSRGIVESPIRNMSMRYAVGELLWYLSGSNLLSGITPYSKFWEKLSDNGKTLNSAYGYRIEKGFGFNQWDHCKSLLRSDPYTRQAVIHIKDASDKPTRDVPCTLSLQFLIRDERLHMNAVMRSNDIWLGFPFDVFCFTSLQTLMSMELGIALGGYTHFAGSLHLYEKDARR